MDSLAEFVRGNEDWKTYLEKNKRLLITVPSSIVPSENSERQESENNDIPETETPDTISSEEITIQPDTNISLENKPYSSLKLTTELSSVKHISSKTFTIAGFRGGAIAGFLAAVIIVIIRYVNGASETPVNTGYENISFEKFMREIFPLLLLFQIFDNALLGWLCCYVAATKNKFFNNIVLFLISFIVTVLLRQAKARDAFYFSGTYHFIDRFGNAITGGGHLGEPDFETLATGIMGAVVFLILVKNFRKINLRAPALKETFGTCKNYSIRVTIRQDYSCSSDRH